MSYKSYYAPWGSTKAALLDIQEGYFCVFAPNLRIADVLKFDFDCRV